MRKPLVWILALALAGAAFFFLIRTRSGGDPFERLMTRGAGYFEQGDATNAISIYLQAVALAPESVDARLNLANAYLLAGDDAKALEQTRETLNLEHDNAAALYLAGLAHLHLNQAEQAVQAFQESQKIDPAVTALNFQLGLAQEKLGNLEDAIAEFEIILQFEPEHPSAHYQLSRLYQRLNRAEDAAKALARHQEILAQAKERPAGPRTFEICKYTEPRIAFKLEQPDPAGITVQFVDATADAFGQTATNFSGPLAVIDYNRDGRNSLFVTEREQGFRLLSNNGGKFEPFGSALPGRTGTKYSECLVGDLNNDRFEDVVILGEQASHVFRFATNGQALDVTAAAGLQEARGRSGLLADLDFTGKLDLLTVSADDQPLRVYRNLGSFFFKENTTNSGLPSWTNVQRALMEDWNNDDLPGVFLSRVNQAPEFFAKQRAGIFVQTNSLADWPAGTVMATGDFNNDLRPDAVVAEANGITIIFGGQIPRVRIAVESFVIKGILPVDYDNDGWLDLSAYGSRLQVWRNVGKNGFSDVSATLGINNISTVESVAAADFDNDGDTDFVLGGTNGLSFWRNNGGNANKQLKLQLIGQRSNATGLGVRVDVTAGNWRTRRALQRLPFEIGIGKHEKIDSLKIHWFDLSTTAVDLALQTQPLPMIELTVPAGSCPYLYVWDGKEFRFVTDILGASPLGLPLAPGRYIEADPEELLALGNEEVFRPKNGAYEVRITEELREVLYLDHAKLVVVDHPRGTVVHPTSKLLPGKPFPPHELWTLKPLRTAQRAVRSDGLDVTEALSSNDNRMASPVKLREPQLRGLAEPFSVTLEFGALETNRPWVLALNGWLRFGGGMANIGGSLDPSLPFPFPTLEAELSDGSWAKLPIQPGAPAGKTKTILVDLESKLPPGARRLRLSTAFEIHWDSIWLCEKESASQSAVNSFLPDETDLHWRGFSQFANLPSFLPLTPIYGAVSPEAPWSRTPAGWMTRYGSVDELLKAKDDALALLNGGDELSLSFKADRLPAKPVGFERSFFLYVVGWDKDADFHVGQGWRVEPFPFLGMDDQAYGREPSKTPDWARKHNTRWVGPKTVTAGIKNR